ncbi:MAG: ADP-glyceromanno-heptose 6-epimerase [Chitinispirillaceae bacterium]|nr:ADP-glyceromanno-heptose 6-epimerase [Chitinispirillaceae bacterium]
MIVVTGGAGFIGSALVCSLNELGHDDILVVDHLGTTEKWKNLVPLRFADYLDKDQFIGRLEDNAFGSSIDTILHLGACSSTTERDATYLMENNFRYTERIGHWWEKHPDTRFIYASSAATYGDGTHGYRDGTDSLDCLRPLNMYGYSKHLFDKVAFRNGWLKRIVGLKYFNVFGPNEYHKGDMRSVINKAFRRVRDEGVISLFRSYHPQYGDGEQLRDFIYVKDAVAMTLFFMEQRSAGGLFNIGTGVARSWNDVAKALFSALGKKPVIEYIEMPEEIQDKYQYFTQADPSALRDAGCTVVCRSLEESITDFVVNYLQHAAHLEPQGNR